MTVCTCGDRFGYIPVYLIPPSPTTGIPFLTSAWQPMQLRLIVAHPPATIRVVILRAHADFDGIGSRIGK